MCCFNLTDEIRKFASISGARLVNHLATVENIAFHVSGDSDFNFWFKFDPFPMETVYLI